MTAGGGLHREENPPHGKAAVPSTAVAEVLAVEHRWTAAHLAGDFATIADLMAPDYIRIQPDGSVAGRAEVLAAYRPGHRHWDHAAGDQYDVRIYGDPGDGSSPPSSSAAGPPAASTTASPSITPPASSPSTSSVTAAGRWSPSSPPSIR